MLLINKTKVVTVKLYYYISVKHAACLPVTIEWAFIFLQPNLRSCISTELFAQSSELFPLDASIVTLFALHAHDYAV